VSYEIKPGTRLRSAVCDAEIVVIRTQATDFDLRCGGVRMLNMDAHRQEGASPSAGFDGGLLVGKRYTDDGATIEVLCTKAGQSSLSLGEVILQPKGAKPLPASD
jgi:hypothetical protein